MTEYEVIKDNQCGKITAGINQMDLSKEECILEKVRKADYYYRNGFNCSQAVFTSFATDFGMSEEVALKVATQFGGGARKGEMCGAVSGALMVLGLKYGHFHYNAPDEKRNAYQIAEAFMNQFIEREGTVVCRELLGYDLSKVEDMDVIKELNLFKDVCPKIIQKATEIVATIYYAKDLNPTTEE